MPLFINDERKHMKRLQPKYFAINLIYKILTYDPSQVNTEVGIALNKLFYVNCVLFFSVHICEIHKVSHYVTNITEEMTNEIQKQAFT
jgi:ubiquinone biosynthesis protein Coq4